MHFRNTFFRTTIGCGMLIAGSLLATTSPSSHADSTEAGSFFARSWLGYSNLSDTDGLIDNADTALLPSVIDVSTSAGFNAGAGIGYRYNHNFAVEFAWEYRSNDSEVQLGTGERFNDGNYASNAFLLNGHYFLDRRGRWEPYLGAGLIWVQEVDIDLEGNGPEQSFSSDGHLGYQVFAGSRFSLTKRWAAHGELRYARVSGIDLNGENNSGSIDGFDYAPLTVQFGIDYRF